MNSDAPVVCSCRRVASSRRRSTPPDLAGNGLRQTHRTRSDECACRGANRARTCAKICAAVVAFGSIPSASAMNAFGSAPCAKDRGEGTTAASATASCSDQHALELEWADPVAARFEHVVGPPDIGQTAIRIPQRHVARSIGRVTRRLQTRRSRRRSPASTRSAPGRARWRSHLPSVSAPSGSSSRIV